MSEVKRESLENDVDKKDVPLSVRLKRGLEQAAEKRALLARQQEDRLEIEDHFDESIRALELEGEDAEIELKVSKQAVATLEDYVSGKEVEDGNLQEALFTLSGNSEKYRVLDKDRDDFDKKVLQKLDGQQQEAEALFKKMMKREHPSLSASEDGLTSQINRLNSLLKQLDGSEFSSRARVLQDGIRLAQEKGSASELVKTDPVELLGHIEVVLHEFQDGTTQDMYYLREGVSEGRETAQYLEDSLDELFDVNEVTYRLMLIRDVVKARVDKDLRQAETDSKIEKQRARATSRFSKKASSVREGRSAPLSPEGKDDDMLKKAGEEIAQLLQRESAFVDSKGGDKKIEPMLFAFKQLDSKRDPTEVVLEIFRDVKKREEAQWKLLSAKDQAKPYAKDTNIGKAFDAYVADPSVRYPDFYAQVDRGIEQEKSRQESVNVSADGSVGSFVASRGVLVKNLYSKLLRKGVL